jgi:hypothetical protein
MTNFYSRWDDFIFQNGKVLCFSLSSKSGKSKEHAFTPLGLDSFVWSKKCMSKTPIFQTENI